MKLEDIKTQEELDAFIAESQKSAAEAAVGDVEGLKSKNQELLGKLKEQSKKAQDAEDATKKQQQEAAKLAGQMDEFEASVRGEYEPKIQAYESEIEGLKGRLLNGEKDRLVESLASKFVSEQVGRMAVSSLIEVSQSEDGGVVTSFKDLDGQVITTDRAKFEEYLTGQEDFKPVLRGVDSSGGGASGGASGAGKASGANDVKGRLQQRLAEKGLISR